MNRNGEAQPTTEANPIRLVMIDHAVIRVLNLDLMIRFYCEVLGCQLERNPATFGFAGLRAGASIIDLVDVHSPLGIKGGCAPDGNAPNMDHLCLLVENTNLEVVQMHLQHHGVVCGEVAIRYGARGYGPSLYLQDPEGNKIEIKGSV